MAVAQMEVRLPDGSVLSVQPSATVADVARRIGPRLYKAAVAAKVNGELRDLSFVLADGDALEIITDDAEEAIEILRHSTAHVLAQAVKRLYRDARLGIGPAIETGFYYDFDIPGGLSAEDLGRIEEEMQRIVAADLEFKRREMSIAEARQLFTELGETYKVELIDELAAGGEDRVSIYEQGEFVDLCRGPHLPSTGRLGAYKLLNVAGAYWRGDENRAMLQRIYGTAFFKKKDLEEHLERLAEAEKRDHRRLGKLLGLFSLHEEGPGFPFFHPKGTVLFNTLVDFWREEHVQRDYLEVKTPAILSEDLWRRSGHWDHYRENMYFTEIDGQRYAIKPMNCPGGMLLYKEEIHSYRDLPLRVAELGLVHRHELSGVLHGLMRVRCFTQDDAHIFMLPEQVKDEIKGVIQLVDHVYRDVFGFDYQVELSTRPEKSMGSDEIWERATTALREALEEMGLPYKVNEGDGAFYGPKIDFHLQDSLGRSWQCATCQLDFLLPERFDLTYVGSDGEKHRPVVIHRVVLGALERFIGILIEHFAGAFPLWLAPVQVMVIPVGEVHKDYAADVANRLRQASIRAEVDSRDEKVGYKIRDAEVQRIPYMLVVGDREVGSATVAVRARQRGDQGSMSLVQFTDMVKEEIRTRAR